MKVILSILIMLGAMAATWAAVAVSARKLVSASQQNKFVYFGFLLAGLIVGIAVKDRLGGDLAGPAAGGAVAGAVIGAGVVVASTVGRRTRR